MTTETETKEYSTVDYVRAALSGDAIQAKEIFNQLMAPRIVDAIADKKTEVAQNYFTSSDAEEASDEQQADAEQSEESAEQETTEPQDNSEPDANKEEEKDENAE